MTDFSVSSGIRSLPTFPLESEEQLLRKYNLQRLVKLASNENCYGPSSTVKQVVGKAASELHRYPEAYGAPLKQKLAELLRVEASQIVLGNGSTEVIEMIAKTFLQAHERCTTALETFPIYRMAVQAVNAACDAVPLSEDRFDLQGLLGTIRSETRLIFIANPNNPTGTALQQTDLNDFIQRVPSNVIIVIDEAYREYADGTLDSIPLIKRYPNVIVLRTLSKVYGLAGLRIGYSVCSPEVAKYLNRSVFPYNVNLTAQLAAIAALQDEQHIRSCVQKNFEERDRMQTEFVARGYRFVPSQTNFILLKVADPLALQQQLLSRGILVAPLQYFHVSDGIRITLGTSEENRILLDALHHLNV